MTAAAPLDLSVLPHDHGFAWGKITVTRAAAHKSGDWQSLIITPGSGPVLELLVSKTGHMKLSASKNGHSEVLLRT